MATELNPQTSEQQNTGLEPIDLGQSRYDFSYLVFPNDLGNEDNSHYMIININVPIKYVDNNPVAAGRYSGITGFGQLLNEKSKVDKLRFPGILNPGIFSGIGGGTNGDRAAFSVPRRTRRITKSIALHMPTPLVYNTHNAYEEISLSALAGRLGTAGLQAMFAAGGAAFASAQKAIDISAGAKAVIDAAGKIVSTGSKLLQSPINPAVEILFANTLVRQFTLEVMMAPRNEKESINMHSIIKTLRFHGAPELSEPFESGGVSFGSGLFWIPPAEFDITFFHKGKENMNILRINTCVLERIEVDYAPTGVYSTFKNGHPVATRLSMGFRELEPVHKKRVLQGF
jgi:hypothetical protein